MGDIQITYVFPEEKLRRFEESMAVYNLMNHPIVIGGKYLCDLDWITYEMYTTTFHEFPEKEIRLFLKRKGYLVKIGKGEMKRATLVYEIDRHLIDIQGRSGKEPDMDYAEKLHLYRVSREFQEWKKKIKEGPKWELL